MVNFNQVLNQYYSTVLDIHDQINTQDKLRVMSLTQIKDIIHRIECAIDQGNIFKQSHKEQFQSLCEEEQSFFHNYYSCMQEDLKSATSASTLQTYLEKNKLADRKLVLASREYTKTISGVFQISCNTSIEVGYIPDRKFCKIYLKSLPTSIFDNQAAYRIFKEFHRILCFDGEIEFENLLFLSDDEYPTLNGELPTDPISIKRYHEKLSSFFYKMGFGFPDSFNMNATPKNYTLIKKEKEDNTGCAQQ